MKMLILNMSLDVPRYELQRQAQLCTWDSIANDDARHVFYFGSGSDKTWMDRNRLYLTCSPDLAFCSFRDKLVFQWSLLQQWDYVFRINNNAYVDKAELIRMASRMPKLKCYAGTVGQTTHAPGVLHVSGNDILMSRDVVSILADGLTDQPSQNSEDGAIAVLLLKHGIAAMPVNRRYNFYYDPRPIPKTHCYQCRDEGRNPEKTVAAMFEIHWSLHKP